MVVSDALQSLTNQVRNLENSSITYCRSAGPWGRGAKEGFFNKWSYKAKVGIQKIFIAYDDNRIGSIMFKDNKFDPSSNGHFSEVFGGSCYGSERKVVEIDFPSEYLTGISGTVGVYFSEHVVTSLTLYTNRTQHGPFGKVSSESFSFNAHNGVIRGFHGRGRYYINAIGVYFEPVRSLNRASKVNNTKRLVRPAKNI